MENNKEKYLKIILAILFLLCLFKMPFGYYQFIRLFGFISFAYLAYKDNNNPLIFIIWCFSAILINPFYKIYFGKIHWNIIDVLWAIILVASIFFKNKKVEKN
ncbi:hypothetical protein ABF176_002572 [Flavobacterium psychrophilum]